MFVTLIWRTVKCRNAGLDTLCHVLISAEYKYSTYVR